MEQDRNKVIVDDQAVVYGLSISAKINDTALFVLVSGYVC